MISRWIEVKVEPDHGMFVRRSWRNEYYPSWTISEQGTESSGVRYIITSKFGSALKSAQSLPEAKATVRLVLGQWARERNR